MIELYLIRHGLAEERSDAWPDDSKRPLTEDGVSKLRKSARGLARLNVAVDVIVTSPFVRTRQTAEIVAAALDPHPHLVVSDALAPGGSLTAIVADLDKHAKRRAIAIVGHEPSIGELAARLIGLRQAIPFKKGAVCRIDVDALPITGHGDLKWFVTPKILRSVLK